MRPAPVAAEVRTDGSGAASAVCVAGCAWGCGCGLGAGCADAAADGRAGAAFGVGAAFACSGLGSLLLRPTQRENRLNAVSGSAAATRGAGFDSAEARLMLVGRLTAGSAGGVSGSRGGTT